MMGSTVIAFVQTQSYSFHSDENVKPFYLNLFKVLHIVCLYIHVFNTVTVYYGYVMCLSCKIDIYNRKENCISALILY